MSVAADVIGQLDRAADLCERFASESAERARLEEAHQWAELADQWNETARLLERLGCFERRPELAERLRTFGCRFLAFLDQVEANARDRATGAEFLDEPET